VKTNPNTYKAIQSPENRTQLKQQKAADFSGLAIDK